MRKWLILSIVGVALSGCATPAPNPWQTLDVTTAPAQTAVTAPSWPVPESFTGTHATFTLAQIQQLEQIRTACVANTGLVNAHAGRIDALNRATIHLKDAGQGQRIISDMRAEQLESERRHHFFERLGYWAIILGLIGAGL